ncbi:hypothetical protein R3P38DRAFT_2813183 [Favolaschia claudopus]|uniref:NAD(+)--protein-arginine ADP-ribosyltransferase n=1 Tax=Favolaschia claudopus TaxID=2862362 RepID=A0AAV9Z5L6_9AGAR
MDHSFVNLWFPAVQQPRRGRSSTGATFLRNPAGPPMRSKFPYSFADELAEQDAVIRRREDYDTRYRGERDPTTVCSDPSCVNHAHHCDDDDDNLGNSQAPVNDDLFLASDDRAASPQLGRSPSPTVTELVGPPPSDYYQERLAMSLARDWRLHNAKLKLEVKKLGIKAAEAAKRRREDFYSPPRKSRRHRRGRREDLSGWGVVDAEAFRMAGFQEETVTDDIPRPLVDKNNVVMAVSAGAPKGQAARWSSLVQHITVALRRFHHNGNFEFCGDTESRVSFGLTYGHPYGAPFPVENNPKNEALLDEIRKDPAFSKLSQYHNYMYRQSAARSFADVSTKADDLVRRGRAMPFIGSVFTTTELVFCDAPIMSRINRDMAHTTFMAVTAFGKYNSKTGGQIVFGDDDKMLEFPAGRTVIFPAGAKEYTFAAVGRNEERFLIRQYCNAGVLRWVEKGGRTDREFDEMASEEEKACWEEIRRQRAEGSVKMFSKLDEIFLL